ncbi:Carbon-nitrogen hydrolase [Paenibacillus sp. cl6col]|uniref:carbon-nitrogen family hydrolase n=1 Tax=Paenibacillus TaxID=44249 RepID=UPI00038569E1|nr:MULTISPECIES: carbon-nitrogen family hydrolase [Paenibacillus]EPY12364.1 Nitrilase/cyanide hydratase and apolipoprotein N-acyltransferase [Paenibacillus alvei A6-6i-x]SDE72620.1 Carbon-nitrogen hydrolase [Paenibacillus sp. cl6col]
MELLWNVCAIQMDVAIGEPDKNMENVIQWIGKAMERDSKPDVIVLPEMWNTGYALERIHEIADVNGQQTKQMLTMLAARYGVNIVGGSVSVREGDQIYNRVYAANRNGDIVGAYDKVHLFQLMDEHVYLSSGNALGTFTLDGVKCGVIICYDLRFPEWTRTMALQGTEVLFVPAEWPHPRLHHWKTLLTARAIENQMYVVACNRVGTSKGASGQETAFFGHSAIIDPWGDTLASSGEQEAFVQAPISLSLVQEVRGRIPVFADRRESLYQSATASYGSAPLLDRV